MDIILYKALRNTTPHEGTCAFADHQIGKRGRTGKEMLDLFASDSRHGHRRFATGIYNNVRWSLKVAKDV